MDRVLSDLQPGLGTTAIVGELTLTKTGTTARTATFPDAAITVAGLGLAQTWTADQTFDVIKAQHCDAATSAGVHIGNATHQDVAIFGAGGGQGTTFYGQVNGTALVLSGAASCTALTATTNIGLTADAAGAYRSIDIVNTNATGYAQLNMYSGSLQSARNVAVGLFIRDYQNGIVPWEWVASSTTALSLTAAGAATFASSVAAGGKFSVTSTATECDFFTGNNANGRQFEMGANVAGIGFLTVRNNTGTIGVNLNGEGSAAFGATGMSASERMRIAGGSAPGTPGATEVLIGAGKISAGAGVSCTTLTATTGDIVGPKVKLTPEGGIATLVVADEAISVGHVCAIIQGGTANRVKKCPISGNENDMPVGVAYSAAGAAGDSFWMVVSGRVGVLPDTGVTAAQGYILTTSSTTAGLVAQAATAPADATHFKEIGHFLNTGSGAGVITDAIVHFN